MILGLTQPAMPSKRSFGSKIFCGESSPGFSFRLVPRSLGHHQADNCSRAHSGRCGFQSLAGTSAGLAGMVGLDVQGIADLARGFDGLYFETGQGSEVTNGAAEGIDMVTLESRTYGVARAIGNSCLRADGERKWMIVNDVAGFIGPEVFRTASQLVRACIEDSVSQAHGITMGLEVCPDFHMGTIPRRCAS